MTNQRLLRSLALAALLHLPLSVSHSEGTAPAKPPAAAPAAEAGCDIGPETYRKLPPETIRQIQDGLAYFGLYGNRIDNIVGRDTRAGLAAYCRQRGMKVGQDAASKQALIDELLLDSAIDRVYRGWREILASKAFSPWEAEQKDKEQIAVQLKSSTPAQIIDIIDRFLKYKPLAAKPARARWPDDHGISYQLTGDDFKALAARQSALTKLAKLKGKSFQDQAAFAAQVREALKGEADALVDLVEEYADTMSVLTLGPQGMARLKAARVPAYLLERLGDLEDPGYPSRAEVEKALQNIPVQLAQELKDYQLANQKGTAKQDSPPANPSAPPVAMASAGAAPEGGELAGEITLRLQSMSLVGANRQGAALEQIVQEMLDETGKWLPVILDQVEESTAYRLSDSAWSKLSAAAGAIPAYALPVLEGMQEVDYPLRSLFAAAARSRIEARLGEYAKSIQDDVASRQLTQVDDKFLEGLKKAKVPAELASRLAALKGKEFPSSQELNAEIAVLFKAQIDLIPAYQDFLAHLAKKKHAPDAAKAVLWSPVADCKCQPKRIKHVVYGFYPFWLAGDAQTVDFSILTRIGYYALGFDESGAIQAGGYWNAGSSQAFETAGKYRTGLDLVVSKSDWAPWAAQSREKRKAAFDNLAANIGLQLGIEPTGALSALKRYLSLGRHRPTLGDGVTLFFEHYPEEAEFIEDFGLFLAKLRQDLAASGHSVNLMLPGDALGKGIYSYPNLARWADIDDRNSEAEGVDDRRVLLLVLLQEPTTLDKKALRRQVEEHFHGAQRRNFLRAMVPVIVPDGRSPIKDDVIYMGDNFGGIGFWPLPAGAQAEQSGGIVKDEYFPQSNIQANAVCGIVCPNRWLFRLAFDFFLLASGGFLAAFLWCCECRNNFRRHFIWYLAGTVVPCFVTGMGLLYCDPSVEKFSEGNSLLFLTLLGIIIYAIWDYRQKKLEKP
ncbi:MAG: hypothetical protein H6R10_1066 [Rhodocyclaceae bacterium]|nr:hypothetical protein [Rhodocyclaceae bacterium]